MIENAIDILNRRIGSKKYMDICNNKLKKNTNTDLILQIAAYFYTYQKSKKMVHGIIDIFPIDGRKHVFVAEE